MLSETSRVSVSSRNFGSSGKEISLTLLHSERPKLYTILAFLSVIGFVYAIKILKSLKADC